MKPSFQVIIFTLALIINYTAFAQEHHHGEKGNASAQSIVKIMQDMNKNLANLSKAIMLEDYDIITLSAHKIANHPPIIKGEIDKLFKRLGEKKEAFIACDTAVHNLAVEIAKAGKKQNMPNILTAHSAMVSKATECHKNFR